MAEAADRCVAHDLADLAKQRDLVSPGAARASRRETLEELLLPHGSDATGNTLSARLVAEEARNPQYNAAKINRVVKRHDDRRTKRGANRSCALERERN